MIKPSPNVPLQIDPAEIQAIHQRLTEILPGIVYRVHLKDHNHMQFLNGHTMAITGYRPEELGGGELCGLDRLIIDEDREQVIREVRCAIADNAPFVVEYRLRHKDGGLRYLQDRGIPVSGPDGTPQFIEGVIFDITGQKLAEQRIRFELSERLRELDDVQRVARLGSYVLDIRTGTISSSPMTDEIFGIGTDYDHTLQGWGRLVAPDQQQEMLAYYEQIVHKRERFEKEYRIVRPNDQTERWLFGTGEVEYDANGPVRMVGTIQDITTRKQAEIARRNSENMLQAMIDTEPECVKLLDAEARVIMMNRAGLAMIEVDDLEQVKGKCVCPLIASEYWDSFMDLTRRVFEGESGTLVFEIAGAKGRHLWLETHAVPFRNEKNEIVALLGVTRDITVQRQAEEALIQSRERYRTLYDETPILMHSIDRNGRLVDVNNHWLRVMGYERDEVLGRNVTDFYTEASRQYALNVIQPAFFRDGSCTDISFQFVKKNGELIDVLLSATGERDAEGTVICSRGVIQDVTKQKRTEETVRQSEQLFRSIIDTVDEGFILLDREFRILTANRSYCEQYGVTETEIIGRHCYEISHHRSTPCYENDEECAIKRVYETGKPCTAMHTHEDKDGNIRHIEARGFPLVNTRGEITSSIEVIHDITDRYRLEAEQLKAQKMEAIGTLAGGIAHDFNNLLQGVFGFLSLAKMDIDSRDEALGALEQAEKALVLSKQLAMQLLTFAKGGKPVKQPVSLERVIKDSTKFALSGSRCKWHVHFEEGLWLSEADQGQIGQVIQNIVLNANQAMPKGGRIEIIAKNVTLPDPGLALNLPPGKYISIVISDNGPGIAAQHLSKIFDPYFTTKQMGSGLGLATSYSIIKNHDGVLEVTSEPGKGTCFSIYLPASELPVETKGPEPQPAVSEKTRGKILVMDDDELIRNVAGQMIRSFGHEVAFAEHGKEAVSKYRQAMEQGDPFDVVILDLTIRGGMGGYETIRELLEIDPKVKAVVSSGYSNDTVLSDFKTHGFVACLNKPYALKNLQEMLQGLL
jgi:two-component system cell cycle sensor histidine kinase/response regulator CckA